MATLMESKITYGPELRPCYANGKKALFHRWRDAANTHGASPFVGGYPAGQYWAVCGIVELESGQIIQVEPAGIQFIDTQKHMDGIAWPEPEEG